MKKGLYLLLLCISALAFLSVSAFRNQGKERVLYSDWATNGVILRYSLAGDYDGAYAGGDGIMKIRDTDIEGIYAPMLETGEGVVAGTRIEYTLKNYTYKKNKLTSTSCFITIFDTDGSKSFTYDGPCVATIKLKHQSCKGSIAFTDESSAAKVAITFTGKLIGQYTIGNAGEISMITPYVNTSDMASINEAFSSDESCPWGFEHNGIDFFPNGNLKPFQAVSSGVIEEVDLFQNDKTSNWQVNVIISHNSLYRVTYAFEPMSLDEEDGNIQMDNILVSVGQDVSQGDIIGYLHTRGSGAHIHFSLLKFWDAICPEPYFTSGARDSILFLLQQTWAGANMCY